MTVKRKMFTSEPCIRGIYFAQSTAPSRQKFILILQKLPLGNIKKVHPCAYFGLK